MKNKIKQDIEKLKTILISDRNIKLAYLFGSYATNKKTALSDVDIAVLFDDKLSKNQMFKKEIELAGKIVGLFENFDLVIMNENIDILLKYNIIRSGIILKDNSIIRPMFEFNTMNEYLDKEYHERLRAEILINRFSERGLK